MVDVAGMNNKLFKKILIGLVAVIVLVAGLYVGVGAASTACTITGGHFGRAEFCGYFTNSDDTWGTSVLPVVDSENYWAIPDSVTDSASFITFLQTTNYSTNYQKITGSAFIVCTMLNYDATTCRTKGILGTENGSDRKVTTAGWSELTDRMALVSINFNIALNNSSYGNGNSYFQGTSYGCTGEESVKDCADKKLDTDDDAFFTRQKAGPGIIMTDRGGATVYALFRECANPVGALPGLPPVVSWSISTATTVDKTTVSAGDTIKWTHVARNDGPNPTDETVSSFYHDGGGLGGGTGPVNYLATGSPSYSAAGSQIIFYSTYTVTQNDIDNMINGGDNADLCRSTIAQPKSNLNNGQTESSMACVSPRIPDQTQQQESGSAAGCDPMIINVPNPPKDAKTGFTVPITVTVVGNSQKDITGSPFSSFRKLNVTDLLTTGDRYTVKLSTPSYVLKLRTVSYDVTTFSNGTYTTSQRSKTVEDRTAMDDDFVMGPCYNYNLKPETPTTNKPDIVEAESSIDISSTVINSETPLPLQNVAATKSDNTQWALTELVFSPAVSITDARNNGKEPFPTDGAVGHDLLCDNNTYFRLASVSCVQVSYEANKTYQPSSTPTPNTLKSISSIGNLPAGTKICFVSSVSKYNSDNSYWRHSIPKCVIVGKKPKVQVWGGDLSVGRALGSLGASSSQPAASVRTSASTKTINGQKKTFGSWIEYGVFAPGAITGAASGSALAGGMIYYDDPTTGKGANNKCNYSTLSFTNTAPGATGCTANTEIGKYNSLTAIPDVEASFSGGVNIPNDKLSDVSVDGVDYSKMAITPSDLDSGIYLYSNSANDILFIKASNLPLGKSIILKVTGKVKFLFDQKNSTGDITNINKIPQLVVIADNIDISHNVKQIDAWLIARGQSGGGYINTCSAVPNEPKTTDGMTINICNDSLIVNGPIMANKIYLNRTAGSTVADPGGPAEIFNLRADAYLWAYNRASGSGHMQTVYTTELPVRL